MHLRSMPTAYDRRLTVIRYMQGEKASVDSS